MVGSFSRNYPFLGPGPTAAVALHLRHAFVSDTRIATTISPSYRDEQGSPGFRSYFPVQGMLLRVLQFYLLT